MPWFKVDDTLHTHPKARRAGLAAMGLWATAGSYCMAYKTDGFVPEWHAAGWPNGKKLAEKLVECGFWEHGEYKGEVGYYYHDWLDYQPSSDDIEADRQHARDRQRKRRAAQRAARDKATES